MVTITGSLQRACLPPSPRKKAPRTRFAKRDLKKSSLTAKLTSTATTTTAHDLTPGPKKIEYILGPICSFASGHPQPHSAVHTAHEQRE